MSKSVSISPTASGRSSAGAPTSSLSWPPTLSSSPWHSWPGLHDDEPGQARAAAINDVREELLGELAIDAAHPARHPVRPTRRDVADFLGMVVLRSAALDLAAAAHQLNDSRWPGQAAVTATSLAADLLTAGDEIASAAGYLDWSDIDTGQ